MLRIRHPLPEPPPKIYRIEADDPAYAPKREDAVEFLIPEPCFHFTKKLLLAGRLGERESLIGLHGFHQNREHERFFGLCPLRPLIVFLIVLGSRNTSLVGKQRGSIPTDSDDAFRHALSYEQ